MEDVLPATHAQEVPRGGHHSEAGETSWVWKGLEARLLCHHQWCSSLNRMLKLLTACFSCTRRQEHLGSLGPNGFVPKRKKLSLLAEQRLEYKGYLPSDPLLPP